MSQDIQLYHACPHLTVEEHVPLESDRRSLITQQPVASSGFVRLLVNDSYFVPSSGLKSPAQVTSAISGPFNVIANENTLTITNSLQSVSVSLPLGKRQSTDTIVKVLKGALTNNVSVLNVNGFIVFVDTETVGEDSVLKVGGTAATSLGFSGQYGSRGRTVYPGWELTQQADTITYRYPKFRAPVMGNPVIKVTYTAPIERCLRCRATGAENDYRFDLQGEPLRVENENLLNQAALKILLTEKGSNPYHSSYGTQIMGMIGAKAVGAVTTLLIEEVYAALTNMQKQQSMQARFQAVTSKERLYRILSVNVTPSPDDPTMFFVYVTVMNASNDPVNITVVFSVPGANSRLGRSNFFPVE